MRCSNREAISLMATASFFVKSFGISECTPLGGTGGVFGRFGRRFARFGGRFESPGGKFEGLGGRCGRLMRFGRFAVGVAGDLGVARFFTAFGTYAKDLVSLLFDVVSDGGSCSLDLSLSF